MSFTYNRRRFINFLFSFSLLYCFRAKGTYVVEWQGTLFFQKKITEKMYYSKIQNEIMDLKKLDRLEKIMRKNGQLISSIEEKFFSDKNKVLWTYTFRTLDDFFVWKKLSLQFIKKGFQYHKIDERIIKKHSKIFWS